MKEKRKWYVVWRGVETGIYEKWDECKKQIHGFGSPLFKSFSSYEEAKKAYVSNPKLYIGKQTGDKSMEINYQSLSVDAACSGNPGDMEYRGVCTETRKELFHVGPLPYGTNNVGEFLALVHGLAWIKKQNLFMPVYSDSEIAILWVRKGKCKTKLQLREANKPVFDLIGRAEEWLQTNSYTTQILKWDTRKWGESPADFGRK